MKWPTHGRYGLDDKPFLHQLDHSKLQDELTEYEQEEVDYAIALSLSGDQKVEYWIEKIIKAQVEDDRQFAAAVQASLLLPSSSSNESKHVTATKICVGCNTEIISGVIGNGVGVWHAECFICYDCKRLIKDHKYYMSENGPHHTFCNRKMGRLKCDVCKNYVPKFNGEVEYSEHPFWKQKYCPSHEQDGTSKCYSCERLEPKDDNKHSMLRDGRKLCFECSSFVIMDTNECQPLLKEILTYFESLKMKVDQKIPLLLVEREALNEAMDGIRNGDTRGLCVSEEQIMPIEGSLLDMLIKPHRLARNCEVTAILILFGLPRLLTGSLLAHEMMHAWLRLNDYPKLKPEIEEGICQVLAHMWLKSKIKSRSSSDIASSSSSSSLRARTSNKSNLTETERELGECFISQIELDASLDYGDGFRVGYQAVSHHGLRETLEHIKLAATFPIISTFVGRDSNL